MILIKVCVSVAVVGEGEEKRKATMEGFQRVWMKGGYYLIYSFKL
jgi:hypothetical protein